MTHRNQWRPAPFRRWAIRQKARLLKFLQFFEPAFPAFVVALILFLILALLKARFSGFGEIAKGVYIDAWGTFLDVLIVAVILVAFEALRNRREAIARYLEEIDDLKKWDSEEARLRVAGNIRRLSRLGKTDIDFSGIVLRDFSFMNQDIESLKGAKFSTGLRLDRLSKNSTKLENVDFTHVDCTGVEFSHDFGGFAALGLVGKNLAFVSASLRDATFAGANLSWDDYVPDEDKWYEDLGEDDDGRPMQNQIHYPPFSGADLTGCSFRHAMLDRADFRDADNILKADFTGAKGLETCFFDEGIKEVVMRSATPK